ncbi:hypothetical protein D3C72_2593060 [compost metagenome]
MHGMGVRVVGVGQQQAGGQRGFRGVTGQPAQAAGQRAQLLFAVVVVEQAGGQPL